MTFTKQSVLQIKLHQNRDEKNGPVVKQARKKVVVNIQDND